MFRLFKNHLLAEYKSSSDIHICYNAKNGRDLVYIKLELM